jgi:hypothetical protein
MDLERNRVQTALNWLRDEYQRLTLREKNGNECSDFINGGKFLDQLSDYQLLRKTAAPCSKLCLYEYV